jgi:hypothetical protein
LERQFVRLALDRNQGQTFQVNIADTDGKHFNIDIIILVCQGFQKNMFACKHIFILNVSIGDHNQLKVLAAIARTVTKHHFPKVLHGTAQE